MDSAIITAMAAIGGSIVGALGTLMSAAVTQRHHDRRELLATQLPRREVLYSDFISESARLLVDALESNVVDPKNMVPTYALLSRIRLSSSPQVLSAAEDVLKVIMETYPKPNLTAEQIRAQTLRHEDPLKFFGEICRTELESVRESF
jgi:hypothetical protein